MKPHNNNGSIIIRFTHVGHRYSVNPGGHFGNRHDYHHALAICSRIQSDIALDRFDFSLQSYRKAAAAKPQYQTTLELWNAYAEPDYDLHIWIRRIIEKSGNPQLMATDWLTAKSPATFNKILTHLRKAYDWAGISPNPWKAVKPRKGEKPAVQVFQSWEITAIFETVSTLYPDYAAFTKFLFLTGCRFGEAVGLTWDKVDWVRNEILINASASRERRGKNRYKRVLKSQTKTKTTRYLSMNPSLRDLLLTVKGSYQDPRNLNRVFLGTLGAAIGDRHFQTIWREVLAAAGVPYRKIHNTRHTFISLAVEQGIPLTGVAYLAGHRGISQVVKTYSHMINRPALPDVVPVHKVAHMTLDNKATTKDSIDQALLTVH